MERILKKLRDESGLPRDSLGKVITSNAGELAHYIYHLENQLAGMVLKFEGLIRASAQIVWTTDANGKPGEDSPTWRDFTGQTEKEWVVDGGWDAVHPDDREKLKDLWTYSTQKKIKFHTKYRLKHKSGDWRWMEVRGVPVIDSQNAVIGWVGLCDDISEQVFAEEALEQSELHFRSLAETVPHFVWLAKADGEVFYWNPAWYSYTGQTPDESYGLGAANAVREDFRQKAIDTWKGAVARQKPFEMEFPLCGRDGSYRWHLAHAQPVRDSQGTVLRWSGAIADIQELKTIQAQLQSEKELREKFVTTLTHDLRNSLASGKSALQLLMRYPDKVELRSKYEGVILKSMNKVDSMIRDLLDANLIQAGKKFPLKDVTRFNISELVEEVIGEVQLAYDNQFILKKAKQIDGFWNRQDISRILENLISNACKYGDSDRPITLSVFSYLNGVKISVHNWGNPIGTENLKNIFSFLTRTDFAYSSGREGWGIGLSLVKAMTEAYGGIVNVSSSEEKGTEFSVYLPSHMELAHL